MLRYLVPLIFMLSSANSWRDWSPKHQLVQPNVQVASESQVKFALESKYDDTGPGAKQPEYAYNTYKNLEDALIAYLDDPDTKLPEHEREKAINKLTRPEIYTHNAAGLFQKEERFKIPHKLQIGQHKNIHTAIHNYPVGKLFYNSQTSKKPVAHEALKAYQVEKELEPFKFQRVQSPKGNPLSLAHYTRVPDPDLREAFDQFDPYPKYTFSYGVHDKHTGDSKSVQESRDGGNVRGFYSFIDSDGKTRTVHYTADDRLGFRANVHKT